MSTYTQHHQRYAEKHRQEITERTREYRKRYYQENKQRLKEAKAVKTMFNVKLEPPVKP